jgi:DNA-binding XRE family transcriptional regulator
VLPGLAGRAPDEAKRNRDNGARVCDRDGMSKTSSNENYLKHFRQDALLTQTELGALAGLSDHAVRAIEAGRRAPKWRSAKRLARALSVPEAAIFPNAVRPPAPPSALAVGVEAEGTPPAAV